MILEAQGWCVERESGEAAIGGREHLVREVVNSMSNADNFEI
jgi:hypothetical protein